MISKTVVFLIFQLFGLIVITHFHVSAASLTPDSGRQRGETSSTGEPSASDETLHNLDHHPDVIADADGLPRSRDDLLEDLDLKENVDERDTLSNFGSAHINHAHDEVKENDETTTKQALQEEAAFNLSKTPSVEGDSQINQENLRGPLDEVIPEQPRVEQNQKIEVDVTSEELNKKDDISNGRGTENIVVDQAVPNATNEVIPSTDNPAVVNETSVPESDHAAAGYDSPSSVEDVAGGATTLPPPHRHSVTVSSSSPQADQSSDSVEHRKLPDNVSAKVESTEEDAKSHSGEFLEPGGRHHSVVKPVEEEALPLDRSDTDEVKNNDNVHNQQPPPATIEQPTATTTTTISPAFVDRSHHRHQPVPPVTVENQPASDAEPTTTPVTIQSTSETPTTTTAATTTMDSRTFGTTVQQTREPEPTPQRHHAVTMPPPTVTAPPRNLDERVPHEHGHEHEEYSGDEHGHDHSREHVQQHQQQHQNDGSGPFHSHQGQIQPPKTDEFVAPTVQVRSEPDAIGKTTDMINKFRHKHQFTTPPPIINIPTTTVAPLVQENPERPFTDEHRDHHAHDHHDDHHHSHDADSLPRQAEPESNTAADETSHGHPTTENDTASNDTSDHQHHHRVSHYLMDDILEHYLDALPLSAKTFLLSQPFGLSLSTTLMATLVPMAIFVWSSISLMVSYLFTPKRVAPSIDIAYVRDLEGKAFALEKELKTLKEEGVGHEKFVDRQGEVDNLQTELVHLRAEVVRLNGVVRDEDVARTDAARKLQHAHDETARYMKSVAAFESKIGEMSVLISSKEEQIIALTTQFQQLQEGFASQAISLERATSDNEALRLQVAQRDEEVGQYMSRYAELEAYCSERVREYESLYKTFSELEILQRSDELNGDSSEETLQKLTEASKVRAELELAKSQVSLLQDELETAKSTLSDLDGKLVTLRDENVEMKRLETAAMQEKREAETKLSVLTEYFTSRELELQKQIGEESVWRKHGENQTDSLSKKVVNLEAEAKFQKEQVDYLKNELAVVEQTHRSAIAREEKKALESWAAARSLERQLKEAHSEAEALRQQLTNAITGANRAAGGPNPPPFMPPPPGLIPPMPPHLLPPPPPPWALRPPSGDRSSQGARSPGAPDSSMLQASSSDLNSSSVPAVSPPRLVPGGQPPGSLPFPHPGARPGAPFVPPPMQHGQLPPRGTPFPPMPQPPPHSTHGMMGTPPARPGMPFPPRQMPPQMAFNAPPPPPPHGARVPYSSNESVRSEDNEEDTSDSESGSTASSSGSDDEELRTLAAVGGPSPPYPRPPFLPPNAQMFPPPPGAPPGQFFPGQMPPPHFPGGQPPPPGGQPMHRGGPPPMQPPFAQYGAPPSNFRPPFPQGMGMPPQMAAAYRPQQQNNPGHGP